MSPPTFLFLTSSAGSMRRVEVIPECGYTIIYAKCMLRSNFLLSQGLPADCPPIHTPSQLAYLGGEPFLTFRLCERFQVPRGYFPPPRRVGASARSAGPGPWGAAPDTQVWMRGGLLPTG